MNHPIDSDIATWVALKNWDEASRLLKTIAVIDDNNKTDRKNLDLFKLFIVFLSYLTVSVKHKYELFSR